MNEDTIFDDPGDAAEDNLPPPHDYSEGYGIQGDPGDEQPEEKPDLTLVEGGATMKSSTMDDVHAWILAALDACEVLCNHSPSREASITMTKLEEAEMWLVKLYGAEGGESA